MSTVTWNDPTIEHYLLLGTAIRGEIGQISTEALRLKRLQGQFVGLLCGHMISTIA